MFFLLIVTVLFAVCYLVYKKLRFWQDRKVLCKKPVFLVGNIWNLVAKKQSLFDFAVDLHNKFPGKRYFGHYQLLKPVLIVSDLDLIKQICIKDFDHFYDHTPLGCAENDPVVFRTLFNLRGEEWKTMRSTLSPAFTSSKMRGMFLLMCECATTFTDQLLRQKGKGEGEVEGVAMEDEEMFGLFSKVANDVISSAVFGIKQNTLENPNNEFYQSGTATSKHMQGMHLILSQTSPLLYRLLGCTVVPSQVIEFFSNVIKDNIAQREARNIVRPDMVHLMMEAKKGKLKHEFDNSEVETGFATAKESQLEKVDSNQKISLTDVDIVAQGFVFYIAGFDTVTTIATLVLYEMAVNPDYQEKLHEEIAEAWQKCNGKLQYEELLRMKYLDQVISETLRKWPPGFQMERQCTREYTIPPASGEEPTVVLRPGQEVLMPVAGIHRNPQYFPDPLRFDPDRFSEENKSKIVPGSYMPFGVGPRNCIGSRFALLEMKVMVFYIILKFSVVPVKKTPIPLKLSAKSFNVRAENGIYLGLKPRQ